MNTLFETGGTIRQIEGTGEYIQRELAREKRRLEEIDLKQGHLSSMVEMQELVNANARKAHREQMTAAALKAELYTAMDDEDRNMERVEELAAEVAAAEVREENDPVKQELRAEMERPYTGPDPLAGAVKGVNTFFRRGCLVIGLASVVVGLFTLQPLVIILGSAAMAVLPVFGNPRKPSAAAHLTGDGWRKPKEPAAPRGQGRRKCHYCGLYQESIACTNCLMPTRSASQ